MTRSFVPLLVFIFILSSCSSRPAVQETSSRPDEEVEPRQEEIGKRDIWGWDYAGPRGPENWASLNSQYYMCGSGKMQSPVNLQWRKPTGTNPLEINYKDGNATLINAGYTLRVEMTPQSQISFAGKDYLLEKIEFRSGSEHHLSGNPLPMEIQFYHRSPNGLKQAIVSLFVITGRGSAWFDRIWEKTENLPNYQSSPTFRFNPDQLIPPRKTFYHYVGSLTHPPCLEGVQWFVFNTPLQLSQEQIEKFRSQFQNNNRPIQELNSRTIINY